MADLCTIFARLSLIHLALTLPALALPQTVIPVSPGLIPFEAQAEIGNITTSVCYGDGYSVSTTTLQSAIDAACVILQDPMLFVGPGETSHLPGAVPVPGYTYMYTYTPAVGEEGTVLIQVKYLTTNALCPLEWPGGIEFSYQTCSEAFFEIIGIVPGTGCGNQGGYGVDVCLQWMIDPNPAVHDGDVTVTVAPESVPVASTTLVVGGLGTPVYSAIGRRA